jgi:uroporphyrinogen-III decarboxylase
LEGFFWFPRQLLGAEPHLYAFYDQPELLNRINTDLLEWNLSILRRLTSICTPDFLTFAEDLSYNHGPMLSRELFEEFIAPFYARIIPELKRLGILSLIDSDGDIAIPAPWFERAGLDGILPLERQAGNDIAQLRRDHPHMRFVGHFDKLIMHLGESALRAEFDRLLPVASGGGYLISCDHQTPPQVSYADYQLYIKLFHEYAHKAAQRR